jgi:hypothetical protein
MTHPEINPATGRPYRAGTLRRRASAAAAAARRATHDALLGRAMDAADVRAGAAAARRSERRASRPGPFPTVLVVGPDDAKKPRDRSLRGKARIRARKAARRIDSKDAA